MTNLLLFVLFLLVDGHQTANLVRPIRVTTLAAEGPGSLRAALLTSGPRLVVFEVGGVIDLGGRSLVIRNPHVTVAGQTAPDPGITLIRGSLTVEASDVVVQHIAVRPGDRGPAPWAPDGIGAHRGNEPVHDVVFDHCSATWAVDENLSASGPADVDPMADPEATSHDVTIRHCLIAEGLSHATHRKGEHSKGTLIHDNTTDIAVLRNLYASNVERSPMFKGGARGIVVNNYIYNPGHTAIRYNLVDHEWGINKHETGQMAIVGNVLRYGPDTRPGLALLTVDGAGPVQVFLEDNLAQDGEGAAIAPLGGNPANILSVAARPTWPAGYAALRAAQVAEHIRREVGARPWDRDAVDARIVNQALAGAGGRVIDSEVQGGGYPPPAPETHQPFDPARWDLATMSPLPASGH